MKPLLYTPCSSRWVLSDIIYIYTLEPTILRSTQTSNHIQKTASNVASKMLLSTVLKRVVTSNVLFILSTLVITSGLCYAINRYKKLNKRKKEAVSSLQENNAVLNPLTPTTLPLQETSPEEVTHDHNVSQETRIQGVLEIGNV